MNSQNRSLRRSASVSPPKFPSPGTSPGFSPGLASGKFETEISLNTIAVSEEQEILGYRSPEDSVTVQAQNVNDKQPQEPVSSRKLPSFAFVIADLATLILSGHEGIRSRNPG